MQSILESTKLRCIEDAGVDPVTGKSVKITRTYGNVLKNVEDSALYALGSAIDNLTEPDTNAIDAIRTWTLIEE